MERNMISSKRHGRRRRNQRGVALITTLLLLMLITGLTLAMAWSAGSDMMITGYYRNFRGSFYAADSGLTIARQDLVLQLEALAPPTFSATAAPIPAGADATVQTYITNTYGKSYQPINSGSVSTSWPEKYKITAVTVKLVPDPVTGLATITTDPKGNITAYDYTYSYSLTAVGQSRGSENATLQDTGTLTLHADVTPATTQMNFAAWGMFIDQFDICSGTLVPGTITGPVFTNGAWTFGTAGPYTFTDTVGSVSQYAGYQFSSGCDNNIAGPSDVKGGVTIAPTFNGGLNLKQNPVPLPKNDFNQARAVLDGKGGSTPVTPADLTGALKNINQVAFPSSAPSTGVFLPYTTTKIDPVTGKPVTIPPTFAGGGIYVQGDASVVLSPAATCTTASCAQTYTITQGGTTTTITVDANANTTTMTSGATSLSIIGVPSQFDPTSGNLIGPDTMLYVTGNITSLSGPGEGQPAIQNGTGLTVTGGKNITITGDVTYKSEPVTLTPTTDANGNAIPVDSLIPANDSKQVLGIFTANGDVIMNDTQLNPTTGKVDGNLEIDASIAELCDPSGGTCTGGCTGTPCVANGGLVNNGAQITNLTIVGGRIQNQIKNINTKTRNVWFDKRFANNGFAPPWFPSTNVNPGKDTAAFKSAQHRTGWMDLTSTY